MAFFLLTALLLLQACHVLCTPCPFDNTTGTLDLSGKNLPVIDQSVFSSTFDCSSFYGDVNRLNLSSSHVTNISSNAFGNFYSLTNLDLSHNEISMIYNETFKSLVVLEILDLSYNNLTRLNAGSLDLYYLREVFLNNNQISEVEAGIVNEVQHSLIYFGLNNNSLTVFEPWPYLTKQTNVRSIDRVFDLQYNKIESFANSIGWEYDLQYPYQVIVNLQYNQLATLNSDSVKQYKPEAQDDEVFALFVSLYMNTTNNPFFCDCKVYSFMEELRNSIFRWRDIEDYRYRCSLPVDVEGIDWLHDIEKDKLVCNVTNDCPVGCLCEDRPHNDTFYVDCSNANLHEMPAAIPSNSRTRIEMNFNNNSITTILNTTYSDRIFNISFVDNKISELTDDSIEYLANTKLLDLRNNRIEKLPRGIQQLNYGTVFLSGNPLRCDCDSTWLPDWMLLDPGSGDMALTCESANGRHTVTEITIHNLGCLNEDLIIIGIIMALVLIVSAIGLVFAKRCPYETKVLLYKIFRFHPGDRYKVIDNDVTKVVDIYLVFDNNDDDVVGWVKGILTKKLNKRKPLYSVLNPMRFTEPGAEEEVVERWVRKAKRILVILSENIFENDLRMSEVAHAERNLVDARARQNANMKDIDNNRVGDGEERELKNAGKIIYVIHNKNEALKNRIENDETWKSRLGEKTILSPDDRLFWSKLRYELPLTGNGVGDGNIQYLNGQLTLKHKHCDDHRHKGPFRPVSAGPSEHSVVIEVEDIENIASRPTCDRNISRTETTGIANFSNDILASSRCGNFGHQKGGPAVFDKLPTKLLSTLQNCKSKVNKK